MEKARVAEGVAFVGVVATHVPAATATAVPGRAVGGKQAWRSGRICASCGAGRPNWRKCRARRGCVCAGCDISIFLAARGPFAILARTHGAYSPGIPASSRRASLRWLLPDRCGAGQAGVRRPCACRSRRDASRPEARHVSIN
jgi:hypothetical protein